MLVYLSDSGMLKAKFLRFNRPKRPFIIVARQVLGVFEAQKLLLLPISFLLMIVTCFNVHFNNILLYFAVN